MTTKRPPRPAVHRSAVPLVYLRQLPSWLVPMVIAALFVVGLAVRGWAGAVRRSSCSETSWGTTDAPGGMVILRAGDLGEAKALLAADPSITSGMFVADVHAWTPVFRSEAPLPKAAAQSDKEKK